MLSTFVGIAACAFDSGGVGGPVDAGFADESGTNTTTSTTSGTTTSDPTEDSVGTTKGSASADGTSEATTDDPIDESSSTASPIDPCAGTGGCDFDASCSPDPSGEVAVCDCNDGFVGNGRTCVIAPSLPMLRAEADCGTTVGDYCTTGGASSEVVRAGERRFS